MLHLQFPWEPRFRFPCHSQKWLSDEVFLPFFPSPIIGVPRMCWLRPTCPERGFCWWWGSSMCPPNATPGCGLGLTETGAGGLETKLGAEPIICTWGGIFLLAARAISAHTSLILVSTLLCFACISTIPFWTIQGCFAFHVAFVTENHLVLGNSKNFYLKCFSTFGPVPTQFLPHILRGFHGSASQ